MSLPGVPSTRPSSRITRPPALTSIFSVPASPRSSSSAKASIPVLPIWNRGICSSGSGLSILARSLSETGPT